MNQQWLTILKSKGIEIEQNLRQQIESAKEEVRTHLKDRGIRLSPADIAALIEEVSPKASHAALSYALDMVRPFSAGMGLRVSRLSDTHIEMVLPVKTRSFNENSQIHEGAFVTASIEAAKVLWMRHAPLGIFESSVGHIEADFLKVHDGECRARIELSESARETVLSELRQRREAKSSVEVKIYDDNEQVLAEIRLQINLKHTPTLS